MVSVSIILIRTAVVPSTMKSSTVISINHAISILGAVDEASNIKGGRHSILTREVHFVGSWTYLVKNLKRSI